MMKRFSSISFAVLAATPVHAMDLRTMALALEEADREQTNSGGRVGSQPSTAETRQDDVVSSPADGSVRFGDATANVGVAPALTVFPDYLHIMWRSTKMLPCVLSY